MLHGKEGPGPNHRPAPDRRHVDLVLTICTTVLFLGFLWIVIGDPTAHSAKSVIYLGFALILYSVATTWIYQRWVDAGQATRGRP